MKNFKRFCLVPFLALSMGTISSCYNVSDEDCKCDDTPKADTPENDTNVQKGIEVSKDGHTLSVDREEIKVLVDAEIGKVKHIVASVTPSSDTITYSSSDTSVATVDENGVITGKKANSSCKITVKSSGDVSLEIDIKTYSVDTYFEFTTASVSGGTGASKYVRRISAIYDRDVEELEFPKTNPFTSEQITGVEEHFSTTLSDIGSYSFEFSKLKKIVIPEGYIDLGYYSFAARAPKCELISLPSTLTKIQSNSLSGLNNLKNIEFPNGNTTFSVSTSQENGAKVLYASTNAYKCFNYPGTGPIFDEGLGITTLQYTSIYNMDNLTDLVIPNGVTTLDSKAVYYNKNLKNVTFPSSYTGYFDGRIFANEKLEGIHFPEGVNYLGTNNRYTNKNKNGEEANCIVDVTITTTDLILGTTKTNLEDEFTSYDGSKTSKITCLYSNAYTGCGLTGIFKIPSKIQYFRGCPFAFNKNLKGVYFPKNILIPTSESNLTYNYRSGSNRCYEFYSYQFNDGELPITPTIFLLGNNKANGSIFLGADKDFTIYYQTRNDGKSFTEAYLDYGAALDNGVNGFIKVVEVADSNLTPVQ